MCTVYLLKEERRKKNAANHAQALRAAGFRLISTTMTLSELT